MVTSPSQIANIEPHKALASPPPASPDAIPEVTWQLLFWALVPLVINTMTQPSGHFCSVPARYRTYLRASPLICLADSISILIRLGYHFIASFQSKRRGALTYTFKYRLSSYLKYRFEHESRSATVGPDDGDASEDQIKAIEKLTWLRWLFFGFGTLGPGVKLMAMQGIYWTKTWGLMLLISFVLVEALVIVSWNRKRFDDDFEPTYDWYNPTSSPLYKVDQVLFMTACAAHLIVMFWLLAELWPQLKSRQTVLQRFFTNPTFSPPARVWGRIVILSIEALFTFISMGLYTAIYASKETLKGLRLENFERVTGWGIYIGTLLGSLAACFWGLYTWVGLLCFVTDIAFMALVALPAVACLRRIDEWTKASPKFFEALQVTTKTRVLDDWLVVPELAKLWCLIAFVYTVVLTIVWYAVKYDSTGTGNPGWTAIFG